MQYRTSELMGRLRMSCEIEQWPLMIPFRIAGYTFEAIDTLVVTLEQDGQVGRGEAAGVYYKDDKPSSMLEQVRALRGSIESGIDRQRLRRILPPGGARNAIDCALWELEAKLTGTSVAQLAGVANPRPLLTTFTCGADDPARMAAAAAAYPNPRAIKLKLTGEVIDPERVRAVRSTLPHVQLTIDANQGFDRARLERLMPVLVEAGVTLIEQPFPVGDEALLDGFASPIPIAADETAQSSVDVSLLAGRFQMVNIKLDKCGGLTEGLEMAHLARKLGLDVMVGNMFGTSLAMAPAYVLGQLCSIVDLDGPLFLQEDRHESVQYSDGYITCPQAVWG